MLIIRQIIIVLSIFGFLYPCSCMEPPPPEDAYEMSNVVFSGQVTDIIEDWNNGFMEISIDVYNVWKGTIDNQVIILTGLDDCGYYFQLNEEYLIYGYYSQMNHIWTDICTRTNLLEYASEDLDYLNGLNNGDINGDGDINILDAVLMVSLILSDEYSLIADVNEDNLINVLDIVLLIEMILNPVDSIQINSGTSYGECWGYCVFELELDNSSALFKASSWGWDPYGELPDLILEDNLNQIVWQQLVDLIDFEYFQSLDDVYGCPDCADGGAEFIEIIYDGVIKLVTFDAYTEIDGIQELTLLLRDLRTDYWNQINPNQECYIVPEVGPCDGICPTFYYNQSTNECEEFITGCCGVEVFSTLQECQNICE